MKIVTNYSPEAKFFGKYPFANNGIVVFNTTFLSFLRNRGGERMK